VVPLRFVALTHCQGCRECARSCGHAPPQHHLADAVRAASETFAAAGVSFVVASVEQVDAPDWWRHGPQPDPRRWRDVFPQAHRIFPWLVPGAFRNPDETKPADLWLELITAVYGRPEEITVFIQQGATRAGTSFPNGGRGVWASDGTFGAGPDSGFRYLFAHELGHYFGLRHPFAHAGTNPVTGAPWRLADRWDLVYRPGSGPDDPHEFFTSRADAARYPDGELRLIETMGPAGSNCQEQAQGALVCVLPGKGRYSETLSSGDEGLQGLSMPLGPAESRRFRWARNALSYGNMAIPRRLSASQIEMVRTFLQHPMVVGDEARKRWGSLPDGMDTVPSYRTTLGRAGAR
jgi:hypothetical protein